MSDAATSPEHVLVRTAATPHESTLECLDGCGRIVVVGVRPPRLTVLSPGAREITHRWSDVDHSGVDLDLRAG